MANGDWALPPHLIVKHERIIVERQSDRADPQVLVRVLVPKVVYKVVPEHTFAVVLTTERTVRTLRSSQQSEEVDRGAQILGTLQQHVKGLHPRLILVACAGTLHSAGFRLVNGVGEGAGAAEEAEEEGGF